MADVWWGSRFLGWEACRGSCRWCVCQGGLGWRSKQGEAIGWGGDHVTWPRLGAVSWAPKAGVEMEKGELELTAAWTTIMCS